MEDATLTPRQAAMATGVSESSIRRWCDQGRLVGERTAGGHRRIRIGSLISFAKQNGIQLNLATATQARSWGGRQAKPSILADRVYQSLTQGDRAALHGLVVDLIGSGRSVARVCDELLAPSLCRIGHGWERRELDIYQEHRATQIVLELLASVKELISVPSELAPVALCGALDRDVYAAAPTMAALVLQEAGWKSIGLGPDTPARSFCQAIEDVRPGVVVISVSYVNDPAAYVEAYNMVRSCTEVHSTAVALGGRGLTQDMRRGLVADFFGDTMTHLASFAAGLRLRTAS